MNAVVKMSRGRKIVLTFAGFCCRNSSMCKVELWYSDVEVSYSHNVIYTRETYSPHSTLRSLDIHESFKVGKLAHLARR